MAQRQAVLGEQRLGLGPAEARLERRGHRVRVDGEQLVEPDQVERDDACEAVTPRDQATDDRRAATEGHERDVPLLAPGDQGGDLLVRGGAHDDIGRVGAVTGAEPEQVGRGLSPGAVQPDLVVGVHVLVADDAAQLDEQALVQRLGEAHVGRVDGRGVRRTDEGVDEVERARGQRGGLGRVAPAGPVHVGR